MSVGNKSKQMFHFHSFITKKMQLKWLQFVIQKVRLAGSSKMVKSIGIYWLCLLSSGSVFMGDPLQPQASHYGHVMQFITQVCSFLSQYNC